MEKQISPRIYYSVFCSAFLLAVVVLLGSTASLAQTNSPTIGVQTILVLLVTFPGATLPSAVTPSSLADMFFAANTPGINVNGSLQEASYGQASATGMVAGAYTLTNSYSGCNGGLMLSDALAAATGAGVNVNNYARVVLVFPDIWDCGFGGFTQVGSNTTLLNANVITSRQIGVENAIHEIGHQLGLLHSGTLTPLITSDIVGPLSSPGTFTDLGDFWCTMGANDLGHYTAPQKAETLGWLPYTAVQSTGTYTILPFESSASGSKALKVQRGTGNAGYYLWLEYRQLLGIYDTTLLDFNNNPYGGALIHYEDPNTQPGHSYLLNFNPTLSWQPALMAGQTWVDPYSDLSLSVISATASGLTVSVAYSGGTGGAGGGVTETLAAGMTVPASSYKRKSTVPATAVVVYGGTAAAGANVTFKLTLPTGNIVTQSGTIDSNGTATWNYTLSPHATLGTYSVVATASYDSSTAVSAPVTFTVN